MLFYFERGKKMGFLSGIFKSRDAPKDSTERLYEVLYETEV